MPTNDWLYCNKTRSSKTLNLCVCYVGTGLFDAIKSETNLEVAVGLKVVVWLDCSAWGKTAVSCWNQSSIYLDWISAPCRQTFTGFPFFSTVNAHTHMHTHFSDCICFLSPRFIWSKSLTIWQINSLSSYYYILSWYCFHSRSVFLGSFSLHLTFFRWLQVLCLLPTEKGHHFTVLHRPLTSLNWNYNYWLCSASSNQAILTTKMTGVGSFMTVYIFKWNASQWLYLCLSKL